MPWSADFFNGEFTDYSFIPVQSVRYISVLLSKFDQEETLR